MDLKEKVAEALQRFLQPEQILLEDDDGISGLVVSPKFRQMTSLDRQTIIDNALRDSAVKLSKAERRRILAIAALTPAEYEALEIKN